MTVPDDVLIVDSLERVDLPLLRRLNRREDIE